MRCRYKKDVVHHINTAYRHQKGYNKISQGNLCILLFLCVTVKQYRKQKHTHLGYEASGNINDAFVHTGRL